jgi:hypothetical protein
MTGVTAGSHGVTVYISVTPGQGFSSVNTETGWNSTFLLEVEEIP